MQIKLNFNFVGSKSLVEAIVYELIMVYYIKIDVSNYHKQF